MTSCLIDANILINFANFCPKDYHDKFWQELLRHVQQRHLIVIESVAQECRHPTRLKQWIGVLREEKLIQVLNRDIIEEAQKIDRQFKMTGTDPGGAIKSVADIHLIAYAKKHGLRIFSYESKRRRGQQMKIPDVCFELDVRVERYPLYLMQEMKFAKCS